MDRDKSRRSTPSAAFAGVLALLLVVCLAECASGSCLSYGHSCWGGHGKRSAKTPVSAPVWFLTKLLRRMDAGNEMNRILRQAPSEPARNDDNNSIFQADRTGDTRKLRMEDVQPDLAANRSPEAKPMLDEDLLNKIKIWQIMKDASEE